jgi:peptide deformylase
LSSCSNINDGSSNIEERNCGVWRELLAIRNILGEDEPLLRKKSRRVDKVNERAKILIADMWDTMYEASGVGLAAPQVGVLRRIVVIDTNRPVFDDEEAEDGSAEAGAESGVAESDGRGSGATERDDPKSGLVEKGDAEPVATEDDIPEPDAAADEPEIEEGVKLTLINPEIVEMSGEFEITPEGCLSIPGHVGRVSRPTWVRVKALDENGDEIEVYAEGYAAKAISHELDHLEGILFTDIEEPPEDDEDEDE